MSDEYLDSLVRSQKRKQTLALVFGGIGFLLLIVVLLFTTCLGNKCHEEEGAVAQARCLQEALDN